MPDNKSIGALWQKQGRSGEFLSGHITIDGKKVDIVAFRSKSTNPKAPIWNILPSTPYQKPGQSFSPQGENLPVIQQDAEDSGIPF